MSRIPFLVALGCALMGPLPARADLVTPGMVNVPWDTPVSDQYRAFGLMFYPSWSATFSQGGWTPLTTDSFIPSGVQSVSFVMPGTGDPATTDTLRIQISSTWQSEFTLDAYGIDGTLLKSFSMLTEPDVEQWVSVEARGIHFFRAEESWWYPPGSWPAMLYNSPGWSMNAVEFTPVRAVPEPGALALFALGALGLLSRARRAHCTRGRAMSGRPMCFAEGSMRRWAFVCAALCWFFAVGARSLRADHTEVAAREQVHRLVEQLGDKSYATREAASKALEAIGEPALSPLQKASDSHPDLEVRRRAARLIRAIGNPLPPGAVMRLGTRRFRTDADIDAFALSPDGKTFVANWQGDRGDGPAVHVWDAATGKRGPGPDPAGSPVDLQFSRDGRRLLALGHPAGGAYLFDMPSGKLLRRLHQTGNEYAVALAPDAQAITVLQVVSEGRLGFRTRPVEGAASAALPGKDFTAAHADFETWQNRAAAYSRCGERLATWGLKGQPIRVYDLKAGRHLFDLAGHRGVVHGCVFSPDGSLLASAGLDRTARVWDLKTGKARLCLNHPAGVFDSAFSPDGSLITACGEWWVGGQHLAGGIRSWDLGTGKERWHYPGYAQRVAVTPDGKRAFAAGGRVVLVLDAASGRPLHPPGHEREVTSVAFSPDGKEVVSTGGWGGQVCVWDPASGRLLRSYRGEAASVSQDTFRGRAGGLFSLDYVAAGENRLALVIRGLDSGREVRRLGPFGMETFGREVVFPRERQPGGWEFCRVRLGEGYVVQALRSPDGKAVVACPSDGPLRLLEAESGKVLRTFGDAVAFPRAAFSGDGKLLAEVPYASERLVRLWDVATGRQIRSWKAGGGGLNDATALSGDGRLLALSGVGGLIQIWDTQMGKEVRRFQGPARKREIGPELHALAFSPDGRTLASGHHDTTVLLWDVSGLAN